MPRTPDPELRRWWRQLLDSFDPQRSTVAEFCDQNEISPTSFYKWRKRFARPPEIDSLIPVEVVHATQTKEDYAALIRIDGITELEIKPSHAYLATDIAVALARFHAEASSDNEVAS